MIIKANSSHKNHVLRLLDNFRTACTAIIDPARNFVSTSARDTGGELFDKVINSPDSAIFLAEVNYNYVGIATVHKIPQIRKGCYVAEIEEMYVEPKFQGQGLAIQLVDSIVGWAQEQDISVVRLESNSELTRAHDFYEKAGFRFYGRAYEKKIV